MVYRALIWENKNSVENRFNSLYYSILLVLCRTSTFGNPPVIEKVLTSE